MVSGLFQIQGPMYLLLPSVDVPFTCNVSLFFLILNIHPLQVTDFEVIEDVVELFTFNLGNVTLT